MSQTQTQTQIPINQELLGKYEKMMDNTGFAAFKDAVEAANEVVNVIENKIPTTQDHYGDYLGLITSMTHAAVYLCAGANRNGVSWAAKINGLI